MKKMMKKWIVLCLTLALAVTSLAACSGNSSEQGENPSAQEEQVKQPELSEIAEAVKEKYGEDYLPSMPLEADMLKEIYGVNMDDVEEFVAEAPMMSAHVDTFIAMKAKEGKGEEIEAQLQKFLDYVVENSVNYPMNVAKVQAGRVVRHGDYVFYVMLGKYDDRLDVSEEDSVKFAKEQVQIGLDTIASFF